MLNPPDERGFTLVELLVAMTILLLVVGALLSALESGMRTERITSNRVDDEQSARLVLAQFAHDVRGATAVLAGTSSPTEVDVETGGAHVRWSFAASALTRSVVDDNTNTSTNGISVSGLANGVAVSPLAFLASDGSDLASLPGVTPGDLQHCTATIVATVVVGAHPPSKPFAETAAAVLRNQTDPAGCP